MQVQKKSTIKKVEKNKDKLEKDLNVNIEIKNNEVLIKGESINVYEAENVINALDRNFPLKTALLLLQPDYIMEDIPIKSIVRKTRNLRDVRARIIGSEGKALQTISELSNCHIVLHDNIVSIIGTFDKIKDAQIAIQNLIRGLKHSKVYNYLEKAKKKPSLYSLGLKNKESI